MKLLDGKVALITGGATGIGKGIVDTFREHGATTLYTYNTTIVDDPFAYHLDVTDYNACRKLIFDINDKYGHIDVLVNNAGICGNKLIVRMDDDEWTKIINTNLNAVFVLTKEVLIGMISRHSGVILNISSVLGLHGGRGQTAYSASKAAMIGLTKSIAKEYGERGIRCNAIAPGFIETKMTQHLDKKLMLEYIPMKCLGNVNNVADSALFLASDMASYITGQTLQVDGGMFI